jgi:recombinational DNA repair ATPase RecF
VRLLELRVEGFGKVVDRTIAFAPQLNVVYGPNEAGKSTLATALLATLYGLGRGEKEDWRPWSGARYATALRYELTDGRSFEIQREFERDAKGLRVYDAHGNDASGECSVNGRTVSPGHAHLGIPLEVFVNGAFVAQGDVAIDGARAERITHALARALDGGPKEDAALGALGRLDVALAEHVGKKKATVNAPLRHLYDELGEAEARASDMRSRLQALHDVRARLEDERSRARDLEVALREHERRGRALRAHTLRSRFDALREIRDDLAALGAERARYDDVEGFPVYLVAELDDLYREWYSLDARARAHAEEAERARLTPALLVELEERQSDGGAIDEQAFAELEEAGAAAIAARNAATLAADRAQSARRAVDGGGELFGAAFAAGSVVLLVAAGLAIARDAMLAVIVAVLGIVLFLFAWTRWSRRRLAQRTASEMQNVADAASAKEREAAARVARVMQPLGVATIEELGQRRARASELAARKAQAAQLSARARATRREVDAASTAFDALAMRLVEQTGARERDVAAAKVRAARRSARDGLDLRLSMLDVRRTDLLAEDDESALEAELAELVAAGVEAAPPAGLTPRAFESERADLERRASEARANVAATGAELATLERQIGDLAALDEYASELRARADRLERFEAAVALARATIDDRTREAHQKFARRLADYASGTLAAVTAERYLDLRVDPTTLAVNVRVPETGAIVGVERLSAGTREQAYLVVRLAMVRMFAEGLETAPLLLDDPFAYWDDARIERSFPILDAAANGAQVVLFTTSPDLARAAAQRGARVLELQPGDGARAGALDRNQNLPLLSQA